jgi:hypothetical protein
MPSKGNAGSYGTSVLNILSTCQASFHFQVKMTLDTDTTVGLIYKTNTRNYERWEKMADWQESQDPMNSMLLSSLGFVFASNI